MKAKHIKLKYGSGPNCANCEHYRFDETCSYDDYHRKPTNKCGDYEKRIKMIRKIVISSMALSVIGYLLFMFLY